MFAVAEKECEFVELTKEQWEAVKDNNPLTWGLPALLHNGKQEIIEMICMNTVHDDEFNVQCCPDDKANVDDFSKALGVVRCDKAAMPEIIHNFPDVRNEPQTQITLTCTQATVIMRARGPQ